VVAGPLAQAPRLSGCAAVPALLLPAKDEIEELDGAELYDGDRSCTSYSALIAARRPYVLTETGEADRLTRRALLDAYAAGETEAAAVVPIRRPDGRICFVRLAAALTEQPETGDVMAFITETDHNDQTVGETVLQTTLREHYDMVAYLAGERFGVVIGDLNHSRRGSLAPCVRTGDYASYLDACVLPYARGEEDAGALLSLSAVEAHLKDDPVWEVNLPFELDGETYFKRFAFYEMDRRAHFYILLLDDTTEVHREQTLRNRRLAEALQEAKRANEAKTVFFSNMSHDIRTPMNAIIGFADLARRSDDPELVRQYLDKIAASGDHLLALINDVLEMSRIESGKMQLEPTATDLVSAMEQVHDLFVGQMSAKGIGFTVETSVTDRWVLCDKTRLDRVLLNLISNAGKFTPEGGSVAVTLD